MRRTEQYKYPHEVWARGFVSHYVVFLSLLLTELPLTVKSQRLKPLTCAPVCVVHSATGSSPNPVSYFHQVHHTRHWPIGETGWTKEDNDQAHLKKKLCIKNKVKTKTNMGILLNAPKPMGEMVIKIRGNKLLHPTKKTQWK